MGDAASDSPVPTLVTAAGQQVLGGHLHVDTPAGADTDPVRNGFHSPECLQEKPRLVSYPERGPPAVTLEDHSRPPTCLVASLSRGQVGSWRPGLVLKQEANLPTTSEMNTLIIFLKLVGFGF